MPEASLSLLRLPDSMIIRRSLSGKNGFIFNHLKPGQYQLYVSNIGYRDTMLSITLTTADTVFNTGAIWLQPAVHSLVEVVVKAIIPPVITKNDTVIYNVSAFKTRPNATVEELLKKLPGIQVDKDGNITMQGEKIQKVFVDGKVFFLNDPKLATQNLLADMVDKVEAFNEKSERAKLTGIPDQDPGKVINLRLKPDKKKGLFGHGEGGLASQNRYGVKANANYFKGNTYLSGVGHSSNGGNLQGSGGTLNNRVNEGSLDYRSNFGEKLVITAGYRRGGNNSGNTVYNQRQTFLQDSSLLQDKETSRFDKQQHHTFTAKVQYTIDSVNSIRSDVSFNMLNNENGNNDYTAGQIIRSNTIYAVNDAFTNNNRSGARWNGAIGIQYDHRFKKAGRYVGISLHKGNSQSKGRTALQSLTRFYSEHGFTTDSLARDQLSFQNGNGHDYSVGITYTEPLARGQILDFSYSLGNGASKAKQEAFNYNGVTGKYDEPDSVASNSFESGNSSQQIALGYNYFRKKLQWQAGISLARNTQLNKDKSGRQTDVHQSITNIFPRASLLYSISKQKNLQVSYNGRNRPPSIQELQPIPDYTNPLLIRLGNPALKQEFTNEISLRYKDFNAAKNRSLFGQLQFNNTAHKIVNATRINSQGAQEQQSVNLEGNYTIGANIEYGISFGKGPNKGNVGFNTSARYDNAVNLVNAEKNIRKTYTWRQTVRAEYYINEKFGATASARFNGDWSNYSVDARKTTTLFWHNYNASLYYELPWHLSISSDINIAINEAQQNLAGTQAAVCNASIIKRLFKNQNGEIKLSAFDILNKSNSFSQFTGDNYIETAKTEVLKRVFVLSFRYNFRINKL
ncbi:hypothetical protein A4R26_00010 [Niastella populi]|uniref:Outer membrane protein beta-barrel domain-containing protein n=1 Tax=Niastella populi TaxID=550983 RepID=A0A1V9GC38_9BACT|nr:hypothetical protein A4R26_00010 [Niastella populi]